MRSLLLASFLCVLLVRGASGFTIDFDYTYDTGNFYAPASAARDSLIAAGAFYESILTDDLEAIVPSGFNTWTMTFDNPSDWAGPDISLVDESMAADTIRIYVGADSLGGSNLGVGGPGSFSSFGTAAWNLLVERRGEPGQTQGPAATEFSLWGGSFSVNTDVSWNFDHTTPPVEFSNENDLYSTILHEMGHILGLGTAPSWSNKVNLSPTPDTWTGVNAVTAYGGEPPLDAASSNAHWDEGVSSTVFGGGLSQEAALDPTLTTEDRKLVTDLDVAALDDIGWDIAYPVPEPASMFFLLVSAPLFFGRRRAS